MREIFKLKIWRTSLVVIAAIVLVSSAVVFYELKKEIKISQAGAGHNVMGFAWSSNIGWISFNDLNCDIDGDGIYNDGGLNGCPNDNSAVFSYGVNVDLGSVSPTFEELSGFAWSKNIGWISFDKAVAGNPPGAPYNAAETFMAKLDTGTGEFSGWARALSACQDDLWDGTKCTGSGAGNRSGGWDGWIKLRKDPADPGFDYGVFLNGADFEGWAWGGNVAGWISFNSSNTGAVNPYKVYFSNNSPTVTPAAPSIPTNWCASSPGSITLPWAFDDAEDGAGNQTAYQIKLTRNPGGAVCDSGKQGSPAAPDSTGSLSGAEINLFAGCANFINYGNYTYDWDIAVWDSSDAPSAVVNGISFGPTPDHQYPTACFTYSAPSDPPKQFEDVTFNPACSATYNGTPIDENIDLAWIWDYTVGDYTIDVNFPAPDVYPLSPPGPIPPQVIHAYLTEDTFTVNLRVTDSAGFSCWASQHTPTGTKDVPIGENMPEWNETMP